ncbi:TetR/AcrR family transcriptional regulator [Nocardioides sp.]|uniref:TetR/AcrR family transcriptional regulator n=1 Tax=Nocardioides sp. TaxID=35761 RepID=UPI003784B978
MSESPRRRQLLDAAQAVIADGGLKGLTHRAVDRRAGLPEGSCSAYLRTRHALQAALAEHVSGQLLADVDELADRLLHSDEPHGFDAALGLLLRWLDQRDLLVARLELTMAATRDPGLAQVLATHRARLVTIVEGIMTTLGKEHGAARAEALVASYDGLLLTALLKPEDERTAFLAESLQLLGSTMAGAPVT